MKFVSIAYPVRRFLLAGLLLAGQAACSIGGDDDPKKFLASARAFLAANDPKSAAIQAKNALQVDVNLAEARYLLGASLLRSGDAAGAEAELRKALAFDYPQEKVAVELAQALLTQRQFKRLLDEFSDMRLSEPAAQASLQNALASAYAAQGKLDLAQRALQAALASDPTNDEARVALARAKAGRGDFDAALSDVARILAATPTHVPAMKLQGDLLRYGKRKPDDALAAYRKAVAAKPDFADAHAEVVGLLIGQGNLDEATTQWQLLRKAAPSGFQTRYYEALLSFKRGDFAAADALVDPLLRVAPDNPWGLQLAGGIALERRDLPRAQAYLSRAVRIAPQADLARRLLVSSFLRAGQPGSAIAALQPALQLAQIDTATLLLAGQAYLQNGDTAKANHFFGLANQKEPANTTALTALAMDQLASGRAEASLGELQTIASSSDDIGADMALIAARLGRAEYDKALLAIDMLQKKQQDKPLAHYLRGRTLLAKRDMRAARASFERALSLDPLYFSSRISLAAMDMAENKPDKARTWFDTVIAKHPKNAQAMIALAELRARSNGTEAEVTELLTRAIAANPSDAAPRLLLIEFHLRNRGVKQAVATAQDGVAALADNADLLEALGRAQQAAGDLSQASAAFGKLAAMRPLAAQPLMQLAAVKVAAGDSLAAESQLRKALALRPDYLDAQQALLLLAIKQQKYADALAVAKTVQGQRPKEDMGYQFEGDVAAAQGNWDSALLAYRRGLTSSPTSGLARKLHAGLTAANKAGERDQFAATWQKDHPDDAAFRLYLADGYLSTKNLVAAERAYLEVTRIQPTNVMAYNNLAWVSGQLDKAGAVGYAEKAVALAPGNPLVIDTLAMLLSARNDYARALEWQAKALLLQPENADIRLNLVRIHLRGGNKDLARKELNQLAQLGDKFRGQAEVARLLKTL